VDPCAAEQAGAGVRVSLRAGTAFLWPPSPSFETRARPRFPLGPCLICGFDVPVFNLGPFSRRPGCFLRLSRL